LLYRAYNEWLGLEIARSMTSNSVAAKSIPTRTALEYLEQVTYTHGAAGQLSADQGWKMAPKKTYTGWPKKNGANLLYSF